MMTNDFQTAGIQSDDFVGHDDATGTQRDGPSMMMVMTVTSVQCRDGSDGYGDDSSIAEGHAREGLEDD